MAESVTTRLGLPRWTADTDTPNRTEFDSAFANLESWAAGFRQGAAVDRPVAGAAVDRFLWWSHDTDELSVNVDTTGAGGWAWRTVPHVDGNGQVRLPDGTQAVPILTFLGDTDTGIFRGGSGAINFVRDGAHVGGFNLNGLLLPDGTAAAPSLSFLNEQDVGIYRVGLNALGIATNGVHQLTIGSNEGIAAAAKFMAPDGTALQPSYSFTGDPDTGVFRPLANRLSVVTGGVEALLVDDAQTVRLTDGSGLRPSLSFLNDSDTGLFRTSSTLSVAVHGEVPGRGVVTTGVRTWEPGVDNTFALGRSIFRWTEVHAVNGTIQTSDVDEKADVRPMDPAEASAFVAALNPSWWRWRDGVRPHAGPTAQGVAAAMTAVGWDDFAGYIDPAAGAPSADENPYAGQPTDEWYVDYVDPDDDPEDQAEQRADAEAEWAEARDEWEAERQERLEAPKGWRPTEVLGGPLLAAVQDLIARVEALEGAA